MQSTTDVECVPVMEVMTQILYGYYSILDELGIKWNTDNYDKEIIPNNVTIPTWLYTQIQQ